MNIKKNKIRKNGRVTPVAVHTISGFCERVFRNYSSSRAAVSCVPAPDFYWGLRGTHFLGLRIMCACMCESAFNTETYRFLNGNMGMNGFCVEE